MDATLELALDLIGRPSITPEDAGCQEVLIARLESLGFRVERLRFGVVDNFWALLETRSKLLVSNNIGIYYFTKYCWTSSSVMISSSR